MYSIGRVNCRGKFKWGEIGKYEGMEKIESV